MLRGATRTDAVLVGTAFATFVLTYGEPALAYIDPGTGSALVYVITALVVSIYFAIRAVYYRLVELVFRSRYKNQKCDLAIHCEDPRYEITFLPVVRALAEQGVELTYFTMYERNDSFEPLPSLVTHQAVAPGMIGYSYLNNLQAKVLVTTTPQLDVMTFRRSKKVKHYCHIPHALGESRHVRPFAYDFFDSVLCCGETLKKNIRRIEQIRGFAAKQLYETGIPHYDELAKAAHQSNVSKERPLVLIAPSWGPLSIFQAFGTDLVRQIAERYDVIVRPHPQMKISQPEIYAEILALKGVTVDTQRTPADVMGRADLLISDFSGIMHEFAFIYEKPVIVIDHKMDLGGFEGYLLGEDSELKKRCRDFIIPVPPSEMNSIVERIAPVLEQHSRTRIVEVREQLVYNFGRAGGVAAQQIRGILQCL
jgi:hypothetical protein